MVINIFSPCQVRIGRRLSSGLKTNATIVELVELVGLVEQEPVELVELVVILELPGLVELASTTWASRRSQG